MLAIHISNSNLHKVNTITSNDKMVNSVSYYIFTHSSLHKIYHCLDYTSTET